MSFRAIILTAAVVLGLAGPVAAETYQVPYKTFFDELKKYEARPNTDRLALRSSLRAKDRDEDLEKVEMTIITADGPVAVTVDEDNAFVLPMNPVWVDERAVVQVNQDPKEFDMRIQVGMKLTDPKAFAYSDVLAAFKQVDGVIEKEAGVFAFVVPSAKTLRVQCGPDCTATLASKAGERVIKADERGRVNIRKDKKLERENPTISLSHPARYTVISTKE
ncbi:DUF2987 domain-containing protein [Indioceanicola profundi]|uniref:DUF2987 domain-containing protein n=1 Tax=Indioceanicola profundi TaxID=2220096 RepID=UPI000E6AB3F7|nr:DUF2987 domain-containing protein [Indioceanicola profundi]